MIAPPAQKTQVLALASVADKLAALPLALEDERRGGTRGRYVPLVPARDVDVVPIRSLPPKAGLSTPVGQARLVHDLASIELQAMELGLRTLIEFPEAPEKFREELAQVTADEGRHLALCLEALIELGYPWGTWPTHTGLWQAVSAEDSLLDRILIVHRYLEGSGLDASETILRRLSGVRAHAAERAVQTIAKDEVGHVAFGSRWYHALCRAQKLDPAEDFAARLNQLRTRLPHRREPLSRGAREKTGFLPAEITALENLALSQNVRSGGASATAPRAISRA